jgi:hypothetical protein
VSVSVYLRSLPRAPRSWSVPFPQVSVARLKASTTLRISQALFALVAAYMDTGATRGLCPGPYRAKFSPIASTMLPRGGMSFLGCTRGEGDKTRILCWFRRW